MHIPLPPLPEQTAIAAFLDREMAKIDALVAEQRRLIDLLREKPQAVISRARRPIAGKARLADGRCSYPVGCRAALPTPDQTARARHPAHASPQTTIRAEPRAAKFQPHTRV